MHGSRALVGLAAVVLACGEPAMTGSEETSSSPSGTSNEPTSSDTSGNTTSLSVTGETTTAVESSGGTDGETTGTTTGTPITMSDTGMPPPPKLCSLEAVHAGDGATMTIDAGDGPGQIPTVIGEVLLRNCGCHYTDDVVPGMYVDYKSNAAPMNTHADFHALFGGTFPQNYENMATYLATEQRVVHSNPLPMPPFGCGIEDGEPGQRISVEDLELLTQWLAAAAPDGANFP
jgi:hypothetical protein